MTTAMDTEPTESYIDEANEDLRSLSARLNRWLPYVPNLIGAGYDASLYLISWMWRFIKRRLRL